MRWLTAALMLALAPAGAEPPAAAPAPVPTMPPHGDTPPVDYALPANWACRPGVDDGTCSINLDAVRIAPDGRRTAAPFRAAAEPPVDCFYVYPTASLDPTLYSDLALDDGEKRSIHAQAARLRTRCRLFVPAYHQLTMAALHYDLARIAAGQPPIDFDADISDRDVVAAWLYYLAHDNHGRGVVLVGHSQGAILLKRLIAEEIDGKPVRKRLVAAYLAGNPDLQATSFRTIPPCAAPDQTGCIVAWSTYPDSYAGRRVFGAAKTGTPPICVNPAAPAGGRAMLDSFLPRPGYAPPEDPPYVELAGQLSAQCIADGDGAVLRVRIEAGPMAGFLAPIFTPRGAGPTWGTHGLDINLVQGNMLDLIGRQTAAYLTRK